MQNWQKSAKKSLKTADSCNNFFQTKQFSDNDFGLKIPLEFANLIDKNNPDDPLLKQVISQPIKPTKLFSKDPLFDAKNTQVAGLIHKYKNRVLLVASRVCAIHCQYCFRQNFDYKNNDIFHNWTAIEAYIRADKNIDEVILSGGDPLSLSDEKLQLLLDKIAKISQLKTLRIHSRTAVVVPSRITDNLADMLNNNKLNTVLVVHSNHPSELSDEFAAAISKLKIVLLNQSVLLKNINDSAEVLSQLSTRLFALKILPYYLHLLDKVAGSQRFLVKDETALKIHNQLKQNLSGYLIPKLVRDNGKSAKTWA